MNIRLAILLALALVIVGVGVFMTRVFADGQTGSDKPVLYMTPADLFQSPRLRALAQAAQHGNVQKIDALIAQGVDVNGHGKNGIGPLFSAVQAGNKVGYKALLDHGASPNNVWTDGETLMNTIACCSPDPYFMKLALEHGGDPNLVAPRTGKTPLLSAVTVSGKANIPLLIKAGADLNRQLPIGKETAMMEAVGDLQFDVVYELLEVGADYSLKDFRGEGNPGWDLEDYVKFSFRANISSDQRQWRDRVIEFLKQHHARTGGPAIEPQNTASSTGQPGSAANSSTSSRQASGSG